MLEEYELTHQTEQKDELPSLLRVGSFKTNAAEKPVPVMLPMEAMNGFCFYTNDQQTRTDALRQMQYIALSLLKQTSPELLKLTFVDDVSGHFSKLRSLKEYDIKFITDRGSQLKHEIEVLKKKATDIANECLGGDYADLREYNRQAEYKEPYNVLFIANFPEEFREEEINDISMLINKCAKCGVMVIMNLDETFFPEDNNYNQKLRAKLNDIARQMPCLDTTKMPKATLNNFDNKVIRDFFAKYNFECEKYPREDENSLIATLNQTRKEQGSQPQNFLSIPIGRRGRDKICLEMGKKAQVYNGLIAGAVGTGKSTLLNNIIASIAEKYSPDELRLYLLDYKDGVEFNQYKKHPNVELLLLDNSRPDVGFEILQQFQKEIGNRNAKFTKLQDLLNLKVGDLDTFNKIAHNNKMPHLLMIVDEAQRLFTNDFGYNKKVNELITDVARRGRSPGIHLLFSSQTYMGTEFEKEAINQMGLRISYKLASPLDCLAILSNGNNDPLTLDAKKYQIVYNANYGNDEKDNIIVDTYDFKSEKVNDILRKASEKYPHRKPEVITVETEKTEQNDNNKKNNYDKDYFGF